MNQSKREVSTNIRLDDIDIKSPSLDLYADIAEEKAKVVASARGEFNKSTQLRRFYDEVLMWEQKSRRCSADEFNNFLPLIRMLKAKVAYAKGRNLVDENFFSLFSHCLSQVNDKDSLRSFKLFFEAFMGFYKVHGK
ncbi:type III-A CRISPR-associated protein Csm2 [Bacterioplanes sanyensis]|uniref:type III-A CRISPR-associated protein Csm2 n=1 Tax=Bacterioplanes sanyensis TaxID=1249553 RepID=UPI00167374C0|nr:type III-A CRISPR-associated protein Csm2 [Bacterioplanes sanyensis]GGY39140.1 type III-A CRISPR-associated protein Csm2 [Bacterioplanes sanyensis]